MKQCSKCKKWFLPEEINKKGYCKICTRDYDWQYRCNISPDEYAKYFNRQKGKCAICHKPYTEEKQMFAVDHCHTTNQIRGLLCRKCNLAIGLLGENPDVLLRAYFYLKGDNIENFFKRTSINLDEVCQRVTELEIDVEYIRKTY